MSRLGKVSLLLSGLSLVILVALRYVLGGWIDYLFIPLGLFLVGLIGSLAFDYKFYLEFLTMRTTKHGMNMGAMILLFLVLLVSVNFLSVRWDESWDVTAEGLNSLSAQSVDALEAAEKDMTVRIFYYEAEGAEELKSQIGRRLELYEQEKADLEVRFHNAYAETALANKYLGDLPDARRQNPGAPIFVFVEYDDKRVRVERPFTEQEITSAMVKATRSGSKSIYFLSGHGERDLAAEDEEGLSTFKQSLEDSSFQVKTLNLLEEARLPNDADVIAIVGSTTQLLPHELKLLRDYARQGGKLFIAVDPGQRHNLPLLTKTFGVEYKNNFIFNDWNRLINMGAAWALGMIFDPNSEITKRFGDGNFTLFHLASEVVPAPDVAPSLKVNEIVQTNDKSFSVTEMEDVEGDVERRVHTVAVTTQGAVPKLGEKDQESDNGDKLDENKDEKPGSDEFAAVVFGDSDFVSNKVIFQGLNRDVALNSMAFLAEEADLITIRPKRPEGTTLTMTRSTQVGVVLAGAALPLVLLVTSGLVWFRRRSA